MKKRKRRSKIGRKFAKKAVVISPSDTRPWTERYTGKTKIKNSAEVIRVAESEEIPKTIPKNGLTLVYWNIRGLCQPIRLALAYAKVKYKDVRIDPGNPDDVATYKRAWFDVKSEVSKCVPFANLPYLLDGDNEVAIPQSGAILRYIGRKFNLMGENEVQLDVMLSEVYDLDSKFTGMCYRNFGQMSEYCKDVLPDILGKFAKQLQRFDSKFLTGKKISIVDFKFFDLLTKFKIVELDKSIGTCAIDSNEEICNYMKRMAEIKTIKEYLNSPRFLDRPLNNAHAAFK